MSGQNTKTCITAGLLVKVFCSKCPADHDFQEVLLDELISGQARCKWCESRFTYLVGSISRNDMQTLFIRAADNLCAAVDFAVWRKEPIIKQALEQYIVVRSALDPT